jgi:hypothetical protein
VVGRDGVALDDPLQSLERRRIHRLTGQRLAGLLTQEVESRDGRIAAATGGAPPQVLKVDVIVAVPAPRVQQGCPVAGLGTEES